MINGALLEENTIEAYLTKLRGQGKNVRRDGLKIVEIYWIDESAFGENATFSAIRKAYKLKSLASHSDKGGVGFQLIDEAWKVLGNHEYKTKYDQYYQDIINNTADNNFKQRVKNRLKELSRKMDSTGGNMDYDGKAEDDGKEIKDISAYVHLFPQDNIIDGTLNRAKTKSGISRWANRVIYVYYLLIPLQDELDGNDKAIHNKNKPPIDTSKLGNYANFKNDIWNCKNLDEINNYANVVRTKIKIVALGKNAPKSNYAYEDAWNENLEILYGLDGWDELTGPENLQHTEKFHFVTGYRNGEKGIRLYQINDSNSFYYRQIINNCQNFIAIKKLVKEKLAELNDLDNAEGGKIQGNFIGSLQAELRKLGELEQVGHQSGSSSSYSGSFTIDYTKMKFKSVSDNNLLTKIDKVFKELRAEISRVGSKPRNSGGGPNHKKSGNPGKDAIQEIEQALKETGFKIRPRNENFVKKWFLIPGSWN